MILDLQLPTKEMKGDEQLLSPNFRLNDPRNFLASHLSIPVIDALIIGKRNRHQLNPPLTNNKAALYHQSITSPCCLSNVAPGISKKVDVSTAKCSCPERVISSDEGTTSEGPFMSDKGIGPRQVNVA